MQGLGISSYSKMLYFFGVTFNTYPAVILDRRLIDVFTSNAFFDFAMFNKISYNSAGRNYMDYLKVVYDLSNELKTNAENIEQFLFIFGKNLKLDQDLSKVKISNIWNGYCPESALKGRRVRMRLNSDDFFESEKTGLQICVLRGVQAIILDFRGKGQFRTDPVYGDEIEQGEILSPQNTNRPPYNSPTVAFGGSDAIKDYIKSIK